jgi:predicted metalloprotease
MKLDNQRRSTNFEVRRGGGGGGMGGGGLGGGGLPVRVRGLGLGGVIIIGILLFAFNFLAPASLKQEVFSKLGTATGGGETQVTTACGTEDTGCDFATAVLGSTEDVWKTQFEQGRLPNYGASPGAYQLPRLVLFYDPAVESGCGTAGADVGPFYCPADNQLYLNPSFYDVMKTRLNAPGDFAQAYVIAHEVGHHIQNLIGATRVGVQGEDRNRTSVRLELQADCFAGVWGKASSTGLGIDDADLREALNAAHAIGDDTLQRGSRGYADPSSFTHGTSEQRMRWFRKGFDSGDARQCDTFAVRDYSQL